MNKMDSISTHGVLQVWSAVAGVADLTDCGAG